MKKISSLKPVVLTLLLFVTASAFAQKSKVEKNKFLEGKKFNIQFYEMKPAGRGKAVPSILLTKGGKIEADLMYEKLSLPPVPFKVILDSTYTEDEMEMHMVSIEADYSADKNDYKWEATIINYDIEGTIVQMKSGVEKKKFEFAGSEKTKK
ncbi:MAG TPA: hypothetical protein VGC65_12215 [Bacteroidia bacterium]|jgi:hypothetical protein